MAQVELTAGGRTFTKEELSDEHSRLWESHRTTVAEIQRIEDEGRRLGRASWAAENLADSKADLRRHQGPIGAVRRVFSPEARQEYQKAQDQVKLWDGVMKDSGVTSPADLERQRSAWKVQEGRLPDLKGQAHGMMDRMNNITFAIRGLDHALERLQRALMRQRAPQRDHEEELERRRSRERDQDRGR
jgi:hypothetical protein